jgi:exopolyphosphatase/guanosine-5'-triphosphate,3'-diphosphate pyrophosphatase
LNTIFKDITLKRYAAIDIGSNTILLLIGQITPQGGFEKVIDIGETTRLGRGLHRGGKLDPLSVKKSIAALKRFSSLCEEKGVEEIACVGTNALRIAKDANAFCHQVHKESGISPRIITDEEEARLSYLSIQKDSLMPQDAVVMDVGGGSTEYIFRHGETSYNQVETISLPLGAVSLTEQFVLHDPPSSSEVQKLQAKIDKALHQIPSPIAGELVGIGGTAVTLGTMHLGQDAFEREKVHGLQLTINELRGQVTELLEKDLAARKEIKGLPPDRADIILAGTMIILATMEQLKKEVIYISAHGLRYGLFDQSFMDAE